MKVNYLFFTNAEGHSGNAMGAVNAFGDTALGQFIANFLTREIKDVEQRGDVLACAEPDALARISADFKDDPKALEDVKFDYTFYGHQVLAACGNCSQWISPDGRIKADFRNRLAAEFKRAWLD